MGSGRLAERSQRAASLTLNTASVRIDGAGTPNVPSAPAAAPRPAAPDSGFAANVQTTNANAASVSAAALALQQQELQKGGGGGGHGGGHAKKALESIDDIAARNSLNIEQRKKTMLDRQAEIERLKAELAGADDDLDENDGERGDGPGEDGPPDDDAAPDGRADAHPA
jgi:hypothetical protein